MNYQESVEQLNELFFRHAKEFTQLSDATMPQGESSVLLLLRWAQEPVFAGELVQRLGLTTGRIANILKKLEEKKLILRQSDHQDHRRVLVRLTKLGAEQADTVHQRLSDIYREIMVFLGEEDTAALLRLLHRLTEYVSS